MKKILLACSVIVSSVFFSYAQNSWDTEQIPVSAPQPTPVYDQPVDASSQGVSQTNQTTSGSGIKLNIGWVRATIDGKPVYINPSTGEYKVITGNGIGISGNANTGQITGAGTIDGVRIGASGVVGNIGQQGGVGMGTNQNFTGILGLFALAQTLVARAVPFLVGVALLAFFWFLIEFIWKGRESAEVQQKAKSGILYSLLAIFVMVSVWGIVIFIGGILGIQQGGQIHGFNLPGE